MPMTAGVTGLAAVPLHASMTCSDTAHYALLGSVPH